MAVRRGRASRARFDVGNQIAMSIAAAGTTTLTFDAAGNQQIEQAPSGPTTNVWSTRTSGPPCCFPAERARQLPTTLTSA